MNLETFLYVKKLIWKMDYRLNWKLMSPYIEPMD